MDPSDIEKLARLARLKITDDTVEQTANSIQEVLTLIDQLQEANTEGVLPMAHPLDAVQRLRSDQVSEPDTREANLAVAPATENGLYLVPKVID